MITKEERERLEKLRGFLDVGIITSDELTELRDLNEKSRSPINEQGV